MEKVLVTGGAGYVGAVLVPKLLKRGYPVKVLDLFLYTEESVFSPNPQLELLKGDLRDRALVQQALDGVDCIIHLAGVSNDPSSDLDPNLTRMVNIEATQELITEAVKRKVRRFINASSSSVYGIKNEPNVTEDLNLEPLTVYSESKVKIEEYLKTKRGKMVAVSIRSATVCGYSPRMRLDLTVNILTHFAKKKGMIKVFGGSQKRPNIHIEDITDLYADLIQTPAELIDGREFNACGANHTVMEIAELVRKIVNPATPVKVEETNDLRSYHISADKIRKELGFTPKRSIADAVKDIALAFEENRIPNSDEDRYYNVKVMKRLLQSH